MEEDDVDDDDKVNIVIQLHNLHIQLLLPSRSALAIQDVQVAVPLLLTLHDAQLAPQAAKIINNRYCKDNKQQMLQR